MIKKSLLKIVCLLIIIGLNWTGLSAIGKTFAYFRDTETASGNSYSAGTLDLEVSLANFDWQTPLPSPESNNTLATSTVYLTNAGSLNFKYRITVPTSTGDLCPNLKISTSTAATGVTLSEFNLQGEINSGNTQEFNFKIYLSEGINLTFHEEESCNFKFSISVWQKEPEGIDENTGFNDSEEVLINIRLIGHYKEWLERLGLSEGDIVINEFLPIAGEFPEFIELYNKGDSTTSISGWEACYADKFEKVFIGWWEKSNWCEQSVAIGNDAVISPDGFYVIYPEDNWIGDDEGIISLWNSEKVLTDAHAYNKDWGDIIIPDKSFARIPDGDPNWMDPIPTPGMPNSTSTNVTTTDAITTDVTSTDATTTEATTTESTTTDEGTTTTEATTTEIYMGATLATSTDEIVTTTEATTSTEETTSAEATTTDEITTTGQEATTTTSASSGQATEEATTSDETTTTEEIIVTDTATETATTTEETVPETTPTDPETILEEPVTLPGDISLDDDSGSGNDDSEPGGDDGGVDDGSASTTDESGTN